jgi:uncharacterized membrane protein YcaP (DUF421 family)
MINIIEPVTLIEIFSIVSRTVVIFLYAFLLLRLLGKRKLTHVTYTDLLLIIAFGSSVGDVMIYNDSIVRFWAAIIAITVVSAIVKILDEVSAHSVIANRIIEGEASLIIDDGKIVDGVLEKENITEGKITSWLRERNVDSIELVSKAFIEPDGEISIIIKK